MFKNHLKIALRQLSRNKIFAGLNVLGLSLGLALAILITMFVQHEYSFDSWMENSENTYRVYRMQTGGTAWTPGQLASKLVTDYPEVTQATGWVPSGERLLTYENERFYVDQTAVVDSTFFEVIPMTLTKGDPKTVLEQPNAMVISADLAQRIFDDKDPIGETVIYDGETPYVIAGILDVGDNKSHINSQIFTRFTYYGSSWGGNNRATYVTLTPGVDTEQLAAKIDKDITELIRAEYISEGYTPSEEDFFRWGLQPLSAIYLESEGFTRVGELWGSKRNVFIFSLIAVLILFVAIINYVNLTTARASQRGKEVGVKKVTGVGRSVLTAQFIIESVLQAVIAGIIALALAELFLPLFNSITDRELAALRSTPLLIILGTMGLALFTGLIAGSYPAFIMSGFNPVNALRSNFMKTGDKGVLRKVLVTGQFAVSITLLIVMAFIYLQVNFMIKKDLGFQPDQVLTIPLNSHQTHYRIADLKDRFKQIPGVKEITTTSAVPGNFIPDWPMLLEGRTERIVPWVQFADADYAKTLNIEMAAGRFIDPQIAADSVNNFFVNEQFVRAYNIENPVGHKLKWVDDENYGQIAGVMKDFHYRGLAHEIGPLVMNANHWRNYAAIKLSTNDLDKTIEDIRTLWATLEPTHPMRYSFLDEEFEAQYADQQRFGQSIFYATLLTLFIALLGLFGLTAFTVERRTKEIGIRKVLGASVSRIVGLLTKDFVTLIGLASMLAIPLAYYLTQQWLEDFAHRIDLSWWVFAGGGLVILSVGFLTVCLQSIKAALTNPVESLRSE